MVLRRGHLLLLALAALALMGASWIAATQLHQPGVAVVLGMAVVGTIAYIAVCGERYRYYERFCLMSLNGRIEAALRKNLRSGGVGRVGGRLYYRSHGRHSRRTPWPRIWIINVGDLAHIRQGMQREIKALVIWPVPFAGGIRYCFHPLTVAHDQRYGYRLQPVSIERHRWIKLHQLDEPHLKALGTELLRVLRDLQSIHNKERIGSKYHIPLDGLR